MRLSAMRWPYSSQTATLTFTLSCRAFAIAAFTIESASARVRVTTRNIPPALPRTPIALTLPSAQGWLEGRKANGTKQDGALVTGQTFSSPPIIERFQIASSLRADMIFGRDRDQRPQIGIDLWPASLRQSRRKPALCQRTSVAVGTRGNADTVVPRIRRTRLAHRTFECVLWIGT